MSFLYIITDILGNYTEINWDTSWMDINSIESDRVNYLNGEIAELESSSDVINNVNTESILRQTIEQRDEIVQCMEGRSRLLNRHNTNPFLVLPQLPERIWQVIAQKMNRDYELERREGISDYVRESLQEQRHSFTEEHNYTRREIRKELEAQVSEIDWSGSFNRLYNNN